jgi:macrodomain Ter protein organizer (MatP/YcbG family)
MSSTLEISKKRKNIDLPIDIYRNLSVKAENEGMKLKPFIEKLLAIEADLLNDDDLYRSLVESNPDGNVYLNSIEQKEFENWLAI